MKSIKKTLNLDRNFVSTIDRFLTAFDKQHPEKSASQTQEIAYYNLLMTQRDIKTKTPS